MHTCTDLFTSELHCKKDNRNLKKILYSTKPLNNKQHILNITLPATGLKLDWLNPVLCSKTPTLYV